MNMVLDEAVEIGKTRQEVGRILVKGDSITLLQEAKPPPKPVPAEPAPQTAGGPPGEGGPPPPGQG